MAQNWQSGIGMKASRPHHRPWHDKVNLALQPLGKADLKQNAKNQIMEILVALIGVGMVLVFPVLAIVALVKANSSSAEIRQLKQRIQRLQDQLDEFKNRFSSSQPPDQTEQQIETKQAAIQPKEAAQQALLVLNTSHSSEE